MIESKNDANRNLEKALEQAKQRVANEKKQNEKKRNAEATLEDAYLYIANKELL